MNDHVGLEFLKQALYEASGSIRLQKKLIMLIYDFTLNDELIKF